MADDYLPPVIARLKLDLGDFDAKLEEAKQKIRDLRKDIRDSITVNVDDAEARAKLDALTRDRKVKVTADVDQSKLGWLSKLTGFGGSSGGLSSLFTTMLGPGGSGPAAKVLGSIPAIASGPVALGALGVVGSLLTEIAGLVGGFAAAGAGGLAFAGLAAPAISNVKTAYQNVSAGQTALQHAQNVYNIDPSKANATALQKAKDNLKAYNKEVQQLGPQGASAVNQIQALMGKGGAIEQAFQPTAVKVFNAALKVMNDLLPSVLPFAQTFGNVLADVLGKFDKFSKSAGFKQWLNQFHALEGPALNSIFTGIGKLAIQFGKLFTVMNPKDVAHAINIAFDTIQGVLVGLRYTIEYTMKIWDGAVIAWRSGSHEVAKAFDAVRHGVASAAHDIAHNFDSIRHAVATWGHDLRSVFDTARHDIAATSDYFSNKINAIIRWFQQMPGRVNSAVGNLGGILVHAGEAAMTGLLNGLTAGFYGKVAGFLSSVAGKIAHLKGPLDYDRVLLVPHGQAIMDGLMEGLGSRMGALTSQLQGITGTIGGVGAAGLGGGVNHIVIELDGRQIYSAMQDRAVTTQRRTGHNGLAKRTR